MDLIDYRLRLIGVPFRWRTLIESFEPESSFVDVQLEGPYHSWRHEHTFAACSDGTIVPDRVEYEVPLGRLGDVAHLLFVKRQLTEIVDFRRIAVESTLLPNEAARVG